MTFGASNCNWAGQGIGDIFFGHGCRTLLSLFFIHLCYKVVSRRWFSPLSKFPGPFWGGITDLYSVYVNLSGEQYIVQYELHKKYGKYSNLYVCVCEGRSVNGWNLQAQLSDINRIS